MALDSNVERGREVVSYVRVGRGMVKVTKYENEQPKSPSDTVSIKSHSSSDRSASTPGPPTRRWLRRPGAKGSSKRVPGTHRHRSRSRSSVGSIHSLHRSGNITPSPGRREGLEPHGVFALNSLPVPGSQRPGEPFCENESNYPNSTPRSSIERGRGQRLHILPPALNASASQTTSHPSPHTPAWTTEPELDPAANAEMWSHITRLEDELVSRFGRGAVPQFASLRHEKSSTPPTTGEKRDQAQALPDEVLAALQLKPPSALRPSEKLKQRSFEPLHLAEPPRRVHRAKSSPALVFPLPPPTMPDWVTNTPLPTPPQGFTPSLATMRAKAGPPPPFAPPPDFPPPPPPTRGKRSKGLDTTEDSEAIAALYRVLLESAANPHVEIGKPMNHDTLRPEDAGKNRRDPGLNEPRPRMASRTRSSGFLSSREDLAGEREGSRTTPTSVTMIQW